eukprot:c14651_g1_i1.p1 GENE.c14651_g1_i1~~c14651_g1_i1.p1  ORF type:complete len:585 (+),score=112.39 c14651_g1_i1:38-1792(+)
MLNLACAIGDTVFSIGATSNDLAAHIHIQTLVEVQRDESFQSEIITKTKAIALLANPRELVVCILCAREILVVDVSNLVLSLRLEPGYQSPLSVARRLPLSTEPVQDWAFQPSTDELLVLDSSGTLRLFDVHSPTLKSSIHLPSTTNPSATPCSFAVVDSPSPSSPSWHDTTIFWTTSDLTIYSLTSLPQSPQPARSVRIESLGPRTPSTRPTGRCKLAAASSSCGRYTVLLGVDTSGAPFVHLTSEAPSEKFQFVPIPIAGAPPPVSGQYNIIRVDEITWLIASSNSGMYLRLPILEELARSADFESFASEPSVVPLRPYSDAVGFACLQNEWLGPRVAIVSRSSIFLEQILDNAPQDTASMRSASERADGAGITFDKLKFDYEKRLRDFQQAIESLGKAKPNEPLMDFVKRITQSTVQAKSHAMNAWNELGRNIDMFEGVGYQQREKLQDLVGNLQDTEANFDGLWADLQEKLQKQQELIGRQQALVAKLECLVAQTRQETLNERIGEVVSDKQTLDDKLDALVDQCTDSLSRINVHDRKAQAQVQELPEGIETVAKELQGMTAALWQEMQKLEQRTNQLKI